MTGDPPAYPTRPNNFFATDFCRSLVDGDYPSSLGASVCWLLTVIVLEEHKAKYRRAVLFFNNQLVKETACGSVDTLDRNRTKAIKAGLLHYVPGRRMCPGRYWVIDPVGQRVTDFEDQADGNLRTGAEQTGFSSAPVRNPLTLSHSPAPSSPDGPSDTSGAGSTKTETKTKKKTKPAKGKSKKPKRPKSEDGAAHQAFVSVFCDLWQAKYTVPYSFAGKKDGKAMKWFREQLRGDAAWFRRIVTAYLAATEPFFRGHSVGKLLLEFSRFKADAANHSASRSNTNTIADAEKNGML